jgi:hypothetical protein
MPRAVLTDAEAAATPPAQFVSLRRSLAKARSESNVAVPISRFTLEPMIIIYVRADRGEYTLLTAEKRIRAT